MWVGGSIALSSVAAFFVSGGITDKLKPSLLMAALLVLLLTLIMNITPRSIKHKFKKRWDRMMYGDMQPGESIESVPEMNAASGHKPPRQDTTLELPVEPVVHQAIPQADVVETVVEPASVQQVVATRVSDKSVNRELVDQAGHAEFIEMDIENEFPETGFVQQDRPGAANSGIFDSVVPNHSGSISDEIVVDDFFDEVDNRNTLDAQAQTPREVVSPAVVDVTQPADLRNKALQDNEHNMLQDGVEHQNEIQHEVYGEKIEPVEHGIAKEVESQPAVHVVEPAEAGDYELEPYTGKSYAARSDAEPLYMENSGVETSDPAIAEPIEEVPELPADTSEIDQLAHAMNSVSGEAVKLQQSVTRINKLHEQEQYYRTQLNGARLAYEKAQEAQFEAHAHDLEKEIKAGEKKLHAEQSDRANLEVNLDDKRRELLQAEMRVTELESELRARQQVFHDQVASLEKTKEMARNAAHLARRAAVMQQRARTAALQERAKRERLEVSAKKAVDIARNAISKLAEEERKNSSSRGLH